jgi:hypothetical protein
VCTEKYIVRDQFGVPKHEWDGVAIEIDDAGVTVKIVEAKNLGSKKRNESAAMEQLRASVSVLCGMRGLTYRRKRVGGMGAVLICRMPVAP